MEHWIKINVIFGVLELIQSGLIALWVWQRLWYVAVLSAATFMGMLVIHVLSGATVIATWVITELRKTLVGESL